MDREAVRRALLPLDSQGDHAACVTALLREGPQGAEVLLVIRRQAEGDPWSGQVALPGGKAQGSERPSETAARELREEVGLDVEDCASWAGCLPMRAPANRPEMAVIPHVAFLEREAAVRCGDEVAEARWAALGPLTANEVHVVRRIRHGEVELPAFRHDGLDVWGLTHRILKEIGEIVLTGGAAGRASGRSK